jgi:hypothetical protein
MPTLTPHDEDDCDAVTLQLISMCRTAMATDDLALADSILSAIGARVATIMSERPHATVPKWSTSQAWYDRTEPAEAVAR